MQSSKQNIVISLVVVMSFLSMAALVSAEELTIVGTGSGVEILKAIGDAFTQNNAGVTIALPKSVGSSGGIKAVARDEAALGRVSRELKADEKAQNLTYVAYAKVPIVFFLNKSIAVNTLSIQQVVEIYSGKITNWKEVGGADAKIRVVTREKGDSSLEVLLNSLPGFKEITITDKAKTTLSDAETESAVVKTPNTIAYGSYPNVKLLDVTLVTIDGKKATDADYPYVATLGLVYKDANYAGTLKQFVEFAASEAASPVITNAGGIPLK